MATANVTRRAGKRGRKTTKRPSSLTAWARKVKAQQADHKRRGVDPVTALGELHDAVALVAVIRAAVHRLEDELADDLELGHITSAMDRAYKLLESAYGAVDRTFVMLGRS